VNLPMLQRFTASTLGAQWLFSPSPFRQHVFPGCRAITSPFNFPSISREIYSANLEPILMMLPPGLLHRRPETGSTLHRFDFGRPVVIQPIATSLIRLPRLQSNSFNLISLLSIPRVGMRSAWETILMILPPDLLLQHPKPTQRFTASTLSPQWSSSPSLFRRYVFPSCPRASQPSDLVPCQPIVGSSSPQHLRKCPQKCSTHHRINTGPPMIIHTLTTSLLHSTSPSHLPTNLPTNQPISLQNQV